MLNTLSVRRRRHSSKQAWEVFTPPVTNLTRAKKQPWDKYYHRAHWRNLRTLVLARDPVCMICRREASTIADHIIPHCGRWELFSALENLQGLCVTCHSKKTAAEDGGFGNIIVKSQSENNTARPIGAGGKAFQSSTIKQSKLDAALDFSVEDLLKDIPK